MPSPVCLISCPPDASSPRRTSASCARTSSSAALSPRRAVISVEPNKQQGKFLITGSRQLEADLASWMCLSPFARVEKRAV